MTGFLVDSIPNSPKLNGNSEENRSERVKACSVILPSSCGLGSFSQSRLTPFSVKPSNTNIWYWPSRTWVKNDRNKMKLDSCLQCILIRKGKLVSNKMRVFSSCLECISIECGKTKTRAIKAANPEWRKISQRANENSSKTSNFLKREKTRTTKVRFALVLNLIGWESGASFLYQSQTKAKTKAVLDYCRQPTKNCSITQFFPNHCWVHWGLLNWTTKKIRNSPEIP